MKVFSEKEKTKVAKDNSAEVLLLLIFLKTTDILRKTINSNRSLRH